MKSAQQPSRLRWSDSTNTASDDPGTVQLGFCLSCDTVLTGPSVAQRAGVIGRFIRTLKARCLWLHRFEILAEARVSSAAFIRRYNEEWILERLEYRTPAIARQKLAGAA